MCGCRAGVQLEPPEGGSAAEPKLGGLCQLVRIVGRQLEFSRSPRSSARREDPEERGSGGGRRLAASADTPRKNRT